jgi:hypothetical protein
LSEVNLHPYSDAARRCSDHVTLAATCGKTGYWMAIRLSDGGSDGIFYDRRADAVRHQLHEKLCAYVKIPPGAMTPKEAEMFLGYHRALYDAGFRLPDPEFSMPLMPLTKKDQRRQISVLARGN